MRRLVYVGPHDRARLRLPGGREVEVEHLGTVDVEQDVADRLREQPANWRLPPEQAKRRVKAADDDDAPARRSEEVNDGDSERS